MIWIKSNESPWPLVLIKLHVHDILVDCIYQLYIIDYDSFWKIHCFNLFSYKSIWDQIWHCHKICQSQPRGIIWTDLKVLMYSMVHTKFRCHPPLGSKEEDFKRFLPYMGIAAILVMWPGLFEDVFVPLFHMKCGFNRASGYWGLKILNLRDLDNEWPWYLIFIKVHVLI